MAESQDVDRTQDDDKREERDHVFMIGRMFPFL
jgi:hypothetical protein